MKINVIRPGVNYGWPTIEGAQTFPNLEPPVTFFNPAIAPSGAAFYQGTRFPQFVGNLFAATLRGTHLLRLVVDAQGRRVTRQERLLEGTFGRLRDVVVGADGYIYICTNNRDGRGSPQARSGVAAVEEERRVHVAVAGVTPAARLELRLRRCLVRGGDHLGQPLDRHADVLADLAAQVRVGCDADPVAPAPQRGDLLGT